MWLSDLPDEILVTIGIWVSCFDLKDFVHFRCCNRKIHALLSQPKVLSSLIDIRCTSTESYRSSIISLVRLHLYEVVKSHNLFEENRAGFNYGSPQVMQDNMAYAHHNINVKGSQARLNCLQNVLRQSNNTFGVVIDAHAGLGAPSLELAESMSRVRGMGICDEWFGEFVTTNTTTEEDDDNDNDNDDNNNNNNNDDNDDEGSSVIVFAWSLEVAEAAVGSNHPYGAVARTGKGWAELRLFIKGGNESDFMLPPRPSYYDGLQPLAFPEGWFDHDRRILEGDDDDEDESLDSEGENNLSIEMDNNNDGDSDGSS